MTQNIANTATRMRARCAISFVVQPCAQLVIDEDRT